MSEYFSEFKWALPKAFSDPLSKCRFEQGDILYDSVQSYSLEWGKAKKTLKNSIQIKSPSTSTTSLLVENSETVFKTNWNSEVILDLFEYPSMEKKELKTTQGNLYLTLWKGNLAYIEKAETQNKVPLLQKDISQILELLRLHFSQSNSKFIFFYPIDETNSLSKEKNAKIEKAFKEKKIKYNFTSQSPSELNLPNANKICPTIKIVFFEIYETKELILASLKKALYVPSKNKKTKKEVFRLKTHGLLTENMSLNSNHYFDISIKKNDGYYNSFYNNFISLTKKLSRKNIEDLLSNKLQLKDNNFLEKPFIQIACETTVNSYFAKNHQDTFEYEKKINSLNNKNVECQFKDNGYTYNIEVKCADFEAKEKIDSQESFKFGSIGRVEGFRDVMSEIGGLMVEGQKRMGANPKPVIEMKKMDNNLKDFLVSANSKFSQIASENEVNILVVCCGNEHDMQDWYNYMFAPTGLFSNNSFDKKNDYSAVDIVVLTNLYHRHYSYFEKPHLKNNWDLNSAFNLVFSSPLRKLNKEKSINHFLNIFPHHTFELANFKLPPDNGSEEIQHALLFAVGIPAFVKHNFTDKGILIF